MTVDLLETIQARKQQSMFEALKGKNSCNSVLHTLRKIALKEERYEFLHMHVCRKTNELSSRKNLSSRTTMQEMIKKILQQDKNDIRWKSELTV